MPTYDYLCKDCGERYEFFIYRKDEKPECPKCKSENAEQQVTKPIGHVIKGASAKNNYGLKR